MKMKKLLIILALVIPFSFITFGQVEDADAQLFGSKRDIAHDFGQITTVVSHDFVIKNTSPSSMTISSFKIPDGFGIILQDKEIASKSSGKFTVTIDPQYVDTKGDFERIIIIEIQQENALGTTKKELKYLIKGSL